MRRAPMLCGVAVRLQPTLCALESQLDALGDIECGCDNEGDVLIMRQRRIAAISPSAFR